MKHTYTIKQVGTDVELKLWRGSELIDKVVVTWVNLGFVNSLRNDIGSPEAIEKQFRLAHKKGVSHLNILSKYELI